MKGAHHRVPEGREPLMSFDALPLVAGTASTVVFVASYLPMLRKAVVTKDLASYSVSSLLLTNLGNAMYSFYVFSLPAGPIWALHSFYLVTSALMIVWYLRFTRRARRSSVVA
jgi:uncharacterized protein with PQ loop repeat